MPTRAAPSQSAAPPDTRAVAPRRVLVVDDNVDSAEMLAEVLQQWGHVAHLAYEGESALREVEAFRPDVVLLDIGLPGLSGYAVAERLSRADVRPVLVALTGYGQAADIARAHEAGFARHSPAPIAPARAPRQASKI